MLRSKNTSNEKKTPTNSTSPREPASRILEKMLNIVRRKLHAAAVHWREDDEHVHQLRVSVRRALAAIRFFQDLVPDPYEDWFRKKLKSVLRATRLARDLDVMVKERLSECGKSKQNLLQKFRSERKNAQQAIVAIRQKLDRKDTFRKHIRHLVNKLRLDAADETENLPISSGEWCLKRFEAISNQFAEVKWSDLDVETLHRLRIEIKQLRYTAEIVEQMTDIPNLIELMTALTAIQQQLGLLQDHVVARKQLQKLVQSDKKGRLQKNLCKLMKDEDLAITESVDSFRNWSKSDNGRSFIQCLENIFSPHEVVPEIKRT